MNTRGKSSDILVDDFVHYMNDAVFEPKPAEEIPEDLRTSKAQYERWNWKIQPTASNPWIEELSQRLPQKWPDLFQSLISRFRFCEFVAGPVMFFANTGRPVFFELNHRIDRDPGIFPLLQRKGYLQFGLPHTGSYDPVCFDMQRRNRGDAPIVQLDHEDMLIRNRIRLVHEIAPSFRAFIERVIAEKLAIH